AAGRQDHRPDSALGQGRERLQVIAGRPQQVLDRLDLVACEQFLGAGAGGIEQQVVLGGAQRVGVGIAVGQGHHVASGGAVGDHLGQFLAGGALGAGVPVLLLVVLRRKRSLSVLTVLLGLLALLALLVLFVLLFLVSALLGRWRGAGVLPGALLLRALLVALLRRVLLGLAGLTGIGQGGQRVLTQRSVVEQCRVQCPGKIGLPGLAHHRRQAIGGRCCHGLSLVDGPGPLLAGGCQRGDHRQFGGALDRVVFGVPEHAGALCVPHLFRGSGHRNTARTPLAVLGERRVLGRDLEAERRGLARGQILAQVVCA